MKTTCSIENCARNSYARGMCHRHYDRLRRSAGPFTTASVAERLAAHLVRKPNGCLEWTGCRDRDGYGRIGFNRKVALTHRVAWELTNGPIPPGMKVLHHCDNPPCCDAEKCLFLGTDADNAADKVSKGRQRSGGREKKTHCPQDHDYSETNTYVTTEGKRQCRICNRAAVARYSAKRAARLRVSAA